MEETPNILNKEFTKITVIDNTTKKELVVITNDEVKINDENLDIKLTPRY